MSWAILLGVAPWALLGGFFLFGIRAPRPLPRASLQEHTPQPPPSVTIIVPARNEARGIVECLTSITLQEYPNFDIVVVDDASTDGTGDLALSVPHGNASEIRVVRGGALPDGWFGKPWACHQGARAAAGELLLFTDADTHHAPDLLSRAVAGMREDGVRALTLNGHQEARTLGELLIQPQMFALIGIRFPRLDRKLSPAQAGDAIANGQYILVEKTVYDEVGGHEAVKGEVAEDLRLAQTLTAAGYSIVFRNAIDSFSTRMYQSLREAIEGWTKNVAVGGQQAAGNFAFLAPIGMVGYLLIFWVIPPLTFALLAVGAVVDSFASVSYGAAQPAIFSLAPSLSQRLFSARLGDLLLWSGGITLLGMITWIGLYRRFLLPVRYALLYPVGAILVTYIAVRSWIRGSKRIEWRGRRYSEGKSVS